MSETNTAVAVILDDDQALSDAWQIIKEYVRVTPTGLLFNQNGQMPLDLYAGLCGIIGEGRKAFRWAIGDALVYGEAHYHDDYDQYTDLLGCAYHTLQQYRRVAARIPYEERDNSTPWTAYQITAHLERETRDELLNDYKEGVLETTDDLRDEVNNLKTGPDCSLLPPCPQCGGKLTSKKCKDCGLDFPRAVWWLHDLLKEGDDDD